MIKFFSLNIFKSKPEMLPFPITFNFFYDLNYPQEIFSVQSYLQKYNYLKNY